jgi:hypothetical protein
MLSSQGSTSRTSTGIILRQTIGQQSAIVNYSDSNLIARLGFQQSDKIKTSIPPFISDTTTNYPNPFIDNVNFQFSFPIARPIKISLFNITGRLVYYKIKESIDNTLKIDNLSFAQGDYFNKLTAVNYS